MGLNLYVVKGLRPDIDLKSLFYAAIPFMVVDMVTIALVMVFPAIATWLPGLVIPSWRPRSPGRAGHRAGVRRGAFEQRRTAHTGDTRHAPWVSTNY